MVRNAAQTQDPLLLFQTHLTAILSLSKTSRFAFRLNQAPVLVVVGEVLGIRA